MDTQMTADEVIEALGLQPPPEGGYYREEYRSEVEGGVWAAATSIYFLLKAG